jgi:hypothetical protein
MEAIIIPKDQFQDLLTKMELIHIRVEKLSQNPMESFIDNSEFVELMKISPRTAQTWRDKKVIAFSQIGAKIYYRLADIQALVLQHKTKSQITSFK